MRLNNPNENKTEIKNEDNPYYLLLKGNEMLVGFFKLIVNNTFYLPGMVCQCCYNKFADCCFSPCLHCDICYECAQKSKKCPNGECNSVEFNRLIDPYH